LITTAGGKCKRQDWDINLKARGFTSKIRLPCLGLAQVS
jgi:hypothetical protein